MDKGWVWNPRASIEYQNGVSTFVKASSGRLGNPTEMLRPCIDCRNLCHQPVNTVEDHLVIRGMDQRYKRNSCWSLHGDVKTDKSSDGPSYDNEAYDLIRTAFFDGEEYSEPHKEDQADGVDCNEEVEFKKKLQDAETPLYSSCRNYTKVSAIMGLYRIKVKSGMSENFFDQLLTLVHDMLPIDNVLPSSTDEMKRFLKMFGFGYDMIHACKNDCILYRKQYKDLQSCPRCNASRWEMDKHSGVEKKGIPAKVLRYFPIKERFRRMFRSKRIAEEVRWHINGASSDGTMRHPVDSITWANVNDKWPEFAAEPRNLRLGLSTDGMNPFSIQNSKYSIWPVLLVNYNMHPTKCMKAENIFLTLLIPGPTAPSNDIDVYLAPLVDDLQDLWNEGIAVFDSFSKEKFSLKAMLMWSITDYPGLGTLAGCKVKGKQACTVCGKHTHFKWLKFSRKHVYLGNRKRLRPDHPYRRRKKWFDNTVEEGKAHRIQSGTEIFEALKDFRNEFGKPLPKQSRRKRKTLCDDEDISEDEYEEDSDNWRWKKRSILFDLPYWKVSRDKVIIYDWNKDNVVVAEGTLISTDPKGMANNIPIGPDDAIVTVDKVVMEDCYMWRPINEKKYLMGSALNEIIAWPISKLGMSTHQDRASPKASSPGSVSCSLTNSKSSGQNKCLLVDVNNSGEIVAEGKFLSNNPEDRVYFVPLGPNASKILVEVVKIANAEVWKPNSEIELVSDAMGSTVAWPNDKVVFL